MRKNLKRVLAAGMAAALAFSVVGCGKEKGKETNKTADSETENSPYAWVVEVKELGEDNNNGSGALFVQDGKMYYASYEYGETSVSTGIVCVPVDNPQELKKLVSYAGTDHSSVNISAIFAGQDGAISFLKEEYTFDPDAVSDMDIDTGDVPKDAEITEEYIAALNIDLAAAGLSFSEVKGMKVGDVVKLYLSLTSDGEIKTEDTSNSRTVSLVTLDADGNEVSSRNITDKLNNFYAQSSFVAKDGLLYMYSEIWKENSDEPERTLMTLDMDSLDTKQYTLSSQMAYVTSTGDGTVVGVIADEEGYSVKLWDTEKGEFSKAVGTISSWIENNIEPAGENAFCYVCDGSLYKFDISDEKQEKIFKFMDLDISSDYVTGLWWKDDEHVVAVTNDYSGKDSRTEINYLTRKNAEDVKQRTEITLGCFGTDQTAEAAVIRFNKSQTDYRITLKDYSSMNGDMDYDEALDKFAEDILAGNGPDIIDMSSLDINRYKDTGLFEDLTSYIKNDSEFSARSFNEKIMNLFKDGDSQIALPMIYSINGVASQKNLLGDGKLTIDKFAQIMEQNPDKEIFSTTSQNEMLNLLFMYNENYFIDYKNKSCNFTDGTFAKVLECAKKFLTEDELMDSYNGDDTTSDETKVSRGDLIFYKTYISDPQQYQVVDLLFNHEFNITGYPSVEGTDLSASVRSVFSISASSKYKEQSWEFIKYMFDYVNENAGDYMNGFPVDNDKMDEYLKKACEPVIDKDENGNGEEVPSTYGFGDGLELKLYALTQEQADAIKKLADSITILAPDQQNGEVYNILQEEAAAFFTGKKSASDVCEVIQSRINIMINEKN